MTDHPYQFIAMIALVVAVSQALSAPAGTQLVRLLGGLVAGAVLIGAYAAWRWLRARRGSPPSD